jgi:protein-tyrosine phosphatase
MDRDNLETLERLRPVGARAALSLLLDHVPGKAGRSVPDPYYGGPRGFEVAWADATAAAEGLLERIRGAR